MAERKRHTIGYAAENSEYASQETRFRAAIALEIHSLRTQAGLTLRQFAARVGTSPSVISRLENGEYQGNLLNMLIRICKGMNCRLQVRLVAVDARRKPPGHSEV